MVPALPKIGKKIEKKKNREKNLEQIVKKFGKKNREKIDVLNLRRNNRLKKCEFFLENNALLFSLCFFQSS